jgi:hypothetical protein
MTREAYLKHKDLIEAWANGAEIEYKYREIVNQFKFEDAWKLIITPEWNEDKEYRIKPVEPEPEFTYPMWFKSNDTGVIVKFDSPGSGRVIDSSEGFNPIGYYSHTWTPHTNKSVWTQISEPKPKKTIMLDTWLIKSAMAGYLTAEGTENYFKQTAHKRIKLLSTREVTIDE